MSTPAVAPLDPRAYALLADEGFGPELFNPTQHAACELVEAYATALAVRLCRDLGLAETLRTPRRLEEVRAERGWVPAILPALDWLLGRLVTTGNAARDGDAHRLPAPLPALDPAAIRAHALALVPAYEPSYALLDAAADAFPKIARGETTGERALLGRMALWIRYFDNANTHYAINNRVAAAAAAARLPPGAAVLEVGAGLGSATEALLEALGPAGRRPSLADYRATEPVAFFARRAERVLRGLYPDVPFAMAPLDVNRPWSAQEIAPASRDLVWGVNVFHLAHDLGDVLAEARCALRPGGWLVVGEGMRPAPDHTVGAELPFRLLESFTSVRLDPARRPTPGFLTAEQWMDALERAGFAEIRVVPDVVRLRAYHGGLMAAAVCGRRP